jgi:F-type H+-transporting ATPase subunit b
MLEFDKWFFVLLVNFLVLIFVLNKILFQPFLQILKERADSTTGFIDESRKMQEEKDRLLEEMKREFSEAASRAREEFEKLKGEGLDRQHEALSKAGGESSALLEKARGELQAATEKARGELRGDVEKFSEEIVRKLAGV